MALSGVMERLLQAWQGDHELCATDALYHSLDLSRLPRQQIVQGEVPGRSGRLALQQP
jgi:hypothetical protein